MARPSIASACGQPGAREEQDHLPFRFRRRTGSPACPEAKTLRCKPTPIAAGCLTSEPNGGGSRDRRVASQVVVQIFQTPWLFVLRSACLSQARHDCAETAPIAPGRELLCSAQCANQWSYVRRRQRVKQMLVDKKIEHHLNPLTALSEIVQGFGRKDIGFAQKDSVAAPPLKEFAHLDEIFKIQLGFFPARIGRLNNEWYRIHPKPRYAQFKPVAHDATNLSPHGRIVRVEIRVEIVKAVKVILPCFFVVCPS